VGNDNLSLLRGGLHSHQNHRGKQERVSQGPSGFKYFNPEEAWKFQAYDVPLHPGAAKYYRDKGMIK
jgi:hypothetical protein